MALDAKMNLCLLVMELLTNAAKHAFQDRSAGDLAVTLTQEGDRLLLRVDDDGRGTPGSSRPGGADSGGLAGGAAHGSGAGLGLRIAQGLARALRGELTVGARPGGGTSVQLRFKRPAAPIAA
jgi:two-component sensor histidine kinase